MIIPVRCWSCGKPVGHLWDEYRVRVAKGEKVSKVLSDLGLKRYCCRSVFLGHLDLIKTVAKFK